MDDQKNEESSVPPVQTEPIGAVEESDIKTPEPAPSVAPMQHSNSVEDKTFFKTRMGHIMLAVFVLVMIGGTAATVYLSSQSSEDSSATIGDLNTSPLDIEQPAAEEEQAEVLDYTQLPLGDGRFVTNEPRQGSIFSCSADLSGSLFTQGPWIDTAAETWDLTQKLTVDGEVSWPNAAYNATTNDNTRVVTSNGLPSHTTGTFPVTSADDSFAFNPNVNQITEQEISLTVPLVPAETDTPTCVGQEVGIATTGALIFSALDTTGHDVVATEVLDTCQGQPQADGFYHYHGYSSCFEDTSSEGEHSDLLGYALDGFGIFGLKGEDGAELSSSDLDECHGHKHNVDWDGETVSIYHYHFTQDYPYTVSCFKGTPLVESLTVGESIGDMMGQEMNPQEGAGPGGPIDDLPAPPGGQ